MAAESSIRVLTKVLGEMKPVDLDPTNKYFQLAQVVNTPWIGRLCAGRIPIEKAVRNDELPNPLQILPVLLKLQQMLRDFYIEEFETIRLFTNTESTDSYAGVEVNVITCKDMLFSPNCDMGNKRWHSLHFSYNASAIAMSQLPEPTSEWRSITDDLFEVIKHFGDDVAGHRREIFGENGQLVFKIEDKTVSKEEFYAKERRNKRPHEEVEEPRTMIGRVAWLANL